LFLSIYFSIYHFILSIYQAIYHFICIYLSYPIIINFMAFHLPISYPCSITDISSNLSVYLSVYTHFIYKFSIYLSVYTFILFSYLSIYLSFYLCTSFIYIYIFFLSVYTFFAFLFFNLSITYLTITGSRSTFEFPSRVNLSDPSLYCIARTWGKSSRNSIGLAGSTRLTQLDFRLNLLLLKGQRCVL